MSITEQLFDDYGYCALGGIPSAQNPKTKHHIKGKFEGGSDHYKNFVPICRFQHDCVEIIKKNNPLLAEALEKYFEQFVKDNLHEDRFIWGRIVLQEVQSYGYGQTYTKNNVKMLKKVKNIKK